MKWTTHAATEFFLRKLGIKFERRTIRFADIDLEASRRNLARGLNTAIIPERVEQYRADMDADEPEPCFPSPVVIQKGSRYILADGNQRCRALAASIHCHAKAEIIVYVLLTDDAALIALATRYFNRLNGEGQTSEHAMRHAEELVAEFPSTTHAELAAAAGVSRQTISKAFKVKEVGEFLKKANIKVAELPKQSVLHISTIKNEPVQAAVAKLAVNHGLTADRVKEITSDVKHGRSEGDQLKKCASWEADLIKHSSNGKVVRPHAKRDRLLRLMRELTNHLSQNRTLPSLQITAKSDADSARAMYDKLSELLSEVFDK